MDSVHDSKQNRLNLLQASFEAVLGQEELGKLVDKSGKALANTPLYFTTNPSFGGRTNNNGQFSLVLPMRGPNGQPLSYSGFFFHNGTRQDFATGQQFSSDTNLGQVNTNVPGQTTSGGGGGGSSSDTTPPTWGASGDGSFPGKLGTVLSLRVLARKERTVPNLPGVRCRNH